MVSAILLVFTLTATAQLSVVKDGKSGSSIIIDSGCETDKEAATILQDFLCRISGATLPIVENPAKAKKGDILIGNFQLKNYKFDPSRLNEDGFLIAADGDNLRIIGGTDKGTIYGVVTLLEQYLGVRYYNKDDCRFPRTASVSFPTINMVENPAMIHRYNGSYGFADKVYAHFMRYDNRNLFAGGYWVHTFNPILPTDVYGASHPEFYSLINGKRQIGKFSQWCLSNPELFELVSHKVDSIFKANPEQDMISLSDNDNDPRQTTSSLIGGYTRYTHCRCDGCSHLDSIYGGVPMGSRAWFLNKIAERFPDKKFSTLAYLFTRQPPKNIVLRPNVNIMLCSIESTHELPYEESSTDFVQDMQYWSGICSDFYNWDYPMDGRNSMAPMPIFHVYQPNMQLYHRNGTDKLFMCIGQDETTQFSELRTFIVSKLMWDPYLDMDSLVGGFMADYYGAAAPYINEYITLQQGALIASGLTHEFYGESPARHANGFLKPALIKRYYELMDKAAKAVEGDAAKSRLIKRDRIALQYAELEAMRTRGGLKESDVAAKLDAFEAVLGEFGVKSVNSLGSPEEYCRVYRQRFSDRGDNLARGCNIEWLSPVENRTFAKVADKAVTDGIYGGISIYDGWVGVEGSDMAFVVDLGEVKDVSTVSTDFFHQNDDWVFMPRRVTFSISEDGKTYKTMGVEAKDEIEDYRKGIVNFVQYKYTSPQSHKARYVKVEAEAVKIAPDWHPGIGLPVWTMIDEIEIN